MFTELEYDLNVAMNKKEKKKRPCETIEINNDEAPHPRDLFVASFEQFKYDVGSRFEDQYTVLEEIAARLNTLEYSVDLVYKTMRRK
jgi:hypothetical protein